MSAQFLSKQGRIPVGWGPPLDVRTGRGSPQVNMFEQVSSLCHQMSLAGGACKVIPHVQGVGPEGSVYNEVPCSRDRAGVRGLGSMYSEVQYIMGDGLISPPPQHRQTCTTENFTFPQLRWWVVKMKNTVTE